MARAVSTSYLLEERQLDSALLRWQAAGRRRQTKTTKETRSGRKRRFIEEDEEDIEREIRALYLRVACYNAKV